MPALSILIVSNLVSLSTVAIAVAVTPTPDRGALSVITGADAYPRPLPVIEIPVTVKLVPPIEHVAAAPAPPPPLIVIVGGDVYPDPPFVNSNLKIDWTFALLVVIATAVATTSPPATFGGSENVTVGVDV